MNNILFFPVAIITDIVAWTGVVARITGSIELDDGRLRRAQLLLDLDQTFKQVHVLCQNGQLLRIVLEAHRHLRCWDLHLWVSNLCK